MIFHNNIFKFFSLLDNFNPNIGCEALKYKKVDAKEFPPDPKERIKKNMEEGRGFRILGSNNNNTTYTFASSNSLWRATL
jgi:hypothetical protein